MSTFLRNQGQYLLQNEYYAFLVAAILALTPVTAWLSSAVVLLITLRKGGYAGLKVLLCSITVIYITYALSIALPSAFCTVFVTSLLGYVAAYLLRITTSWKIVALFILIIALLGICLIHWFMPSYINEQFQLLLATLKEIDANNTVMQLLETQQHVNPAMLMNFLLGIKILSIIFSALSSLMLARWVQSLLFYPGGFRREMLAFRASSIGLFLLVVTIMGVYQNNPLSMSCLPLLAVYLMAAGISLFVTVMARKKDLVTFLLLFVPLVIVPYIMLPIYIFLGSLDSLFNFRLRLAASRQIKN